MENEYTREGMHLMHGNLCTTHKGKDNDPIALLLYCFASFMHHFSSIQRITLNVSAVIFTLCFMLNSLLFMQLQSSSHDFNKLPLMNNLELVEHLKLLVTIKPADSILSKPTSTPPYLTIAVKI